MKITTTQLRRIIREEIDQAARKTPKSKAKAPAAAAWGHKPKPKPKANPAAIAAQVVDIVGQGTVEDYLSVADVVLDFMATPADDPDEAVDAVADALGGAITASMVASDEGDELDFDAMAAAGDICAAFGI